MIDSENKGGIVQLQEPPQENSGILALADCVRFRPMTVADLDELMSIEQSAYPFPWSRGFFLQELQVACARSILAEVDGVIAGYVLYWLLPGTIDIHNLATHLQYRRRGVARLLLKRALGHAREQSISRVTLEVRKSNVPAQKLYESMGFVVTGLREGYYSDNGEDALAMTLTVTTPG